VQTEAALSWEADEWRREALRDSVARMPLTDLRFALALPGEED
jgi:hypothetical protein